MTELYHQLGYRYQWNMDSIEDDGTGDGIIIAPRSMSRDIVVSLPLHIRQKALFDPQFYLPNSARGELCTYEFFPQMVANQFTTNEWTEEQALTTGFGCLNFQISCDFRFLVIPTRFREGMPSNYIENQLTAFVNPFLRAYDELGRPKPCLLELILTDQMLKDASYRRDVLNWITRIDQIDGIYLIYQHQRTHKQIDDIEFLHAVDYFVKALKQAGMIVVMGYLNTESLPLLCTEPDIMTLGSYENLRKFSTMSFEVEQPGGRPMRGPNPRIYVSRLLQWVEYNYLGAVARAVGNLDKFLDDSAHRIAMFEPTYRWHFQKPEPYQHYFVAFSSQFRRLASLHGADRLNAIREECGHAISEYERLAEKGLVFDTDSGGRHLYSWLTFLNQR